MRSRRIRRLMSGGAVLALAAVLLPGGLGDPAGAQAATVSPAATTTPSSSIAHAAADGKTFDPTHAYVPGTAITLQTAAETAADVATPGESGAGTGSSATSATSSTSPTSPTLPSASGTTSAAPSSTTSTTTPLGTANAAGGSLGLNTSGSVETAQGTAMTSTLPGGDSLQVYSLGVISLTRPDGSTIWQRSTGSLYNDWHLSFPDPGGYVVTPQLVIGTDPADPFELTTAEPYAMTDTHPYAVGDLTGNSNGNGDGDTDIAVAESVGVNLGAAECGDCGWTFSVPGSNLHLGTFVTVLDSRTGATLYSELDPGFVTQLAIVGRNLVVGDVTGSPTGESGPGAWGSASTVKELTFHGVARGKLAASQVWQYSTAAQWGLLLGLQAVGGSGSVAVAWSDTPLGLGEPGPPDGHVVLIDAHGHVSWDQRTAGYPVLSAYDASRNELAVVEETDPTQAVSYTLAGLRISDGRTVSSSTTTDVLPTALTIGTLSPHSSPSWLVAGVVTTAADVEPPAFTFTAGTVTAFDPDSATRVWSRTLAGSDSSDGNAPEPGAVEIVDGSHGQTSVVVGSWEGTAMPSPTSTLSEDNDVQGLSGATGAVQWDRSGDVPDPLTLATSGNAVRGITPEQDALSYDAASGKSAGDAPLMGEFNTAIAANVGGSGRLDYITGDESGAVYAFDGATFTAGDDAPRVLWRADVGGPVNEIVPGVIDGRKVLAVAATTGIAVIDERTGQVLHWMALPGQYVWNVAIGDAGGRSVVVSATDRVSAFDAATGQALWTYQPSSAVYFADASVVDSAVVTEYQSQVDVGQSPTTMAAVGIDAGTGHTLWTAAADPSTIASAQLRNGVVAGQGIPGAGAYGAAFTWTTSDYDGQVDVRNARTGTLLYSNTEADLGGHESYTLVPGVGLIAIGEGGTVSIAPGGPTESDWLTGSDVAVAEAGGTPVLLDAQAGLSAWPMSVVASGANPVDPLAQGFAFLAGKLDVTSDNTVLALPINWTEHEITTEENGQFAFPYNVAIQQGLEVLSLTGTPAANAVRRPQTQTQAQTPTQTPASRPSTLSLANTAAGNEKIATAQPAAQVEVHGYSATGVPQLTETAPSGYDPATMRAYLGLSGTGAGQTVAVVDAYGDPNIAADVNQFSSEYGLPQNCSGSTTSGCFHLTVTDADPAADYGTADPDWGLETSMDVEWIHAVAPQAAVVLVEAAEGSFSSLFHAVTVAAQLRPDAVSMSWGIGGEFTDETYYDHFCQISNSLCVAATGDYGYPGSYPAYNPSVLAVGGTSLDLTAAGVVSSEVAWSGSGGGQSYVEPTPAYQAGVAPGGRGIPDVSYDADPATGVAVYDSYAFDGQSGWFQVGGTSLGAPSWSAILASADQLRAAAGKPRLTSADDAAQQAVYASAGHLGDILTGSNGFCPDICSAGPGYDFVTGLGSPRTGLDATLEAAP